MSGLCGWIGGAQALPDPERANHQMASALPHYDVETSQGHSGPHFGLSLRSRAGEGHWHRDGDLSVALEGYPVWRHPGRAEAARTRGHAFALAEAYRERGEGLFDELHGAFVLAVVEQASGCALVGIDRFGIQGLCYAESGKGGLVFGSTADSVRAHPQVAATIRPQSIFNYLYFIDRVPAPDTIYREQRKLLPGHFLSYAQGRWAAKTYWRMPYIEDSGARLEPLAAELPARLRAAVSRSMEGEAPSKVAAFLSGGLDSSTITGLLAEIAPGRSKAFTIGFAMDGFDETEYASAAAAHFKAEHHVYSVTAQDELDALPKIAEIYDEPFANSSAIAAYVCALRARESGVDLMLAGDGGDELFAGNSRYLSDGVFDHYRMIPGMFRQGLIEPLLGGPAAGGGPALLRKARNYVHYARMSVPQRLTLHNVFRGVEAAALFDPDLLAEIDPAAALGRAEEIYASATSRSKLQRMMSFDLRLTLADSDLRKVGRACELAGVRVKYPFLDEEVATFAAGVPARLMNQNGELRSFYKRAFADYLPRQVLEKKKQGFGVPCLEFVDAYEPLQNFVGDCIQSLRSRRVFRTGFLDELAAQIRQANSTCHNGVIWDLTALELWFRSRSRSRSLSL